MKLIDFVFNKFTVKDCYYRQHLFTILKELLEDPSFEEHAQQFTKISTTLFVCNEVVEATKTCLSNIFIY